MSVDIQGQQPERPSPGDPTVRALLAKNERAIRRYIARRMGPSVLKRASVDDIFQDTAAQAVKSADNYVHRDDTAFMGWVCTIARRVISRLLSGYQGQLQSVRIKGAYSSAAGIPEGELRGRTRTPSSFAAVDEHTAMLREVIRTLPAMHREVLTLYKLQQMQLADVAKRIGRSEGQTSRIAAQAIQLARAQMINR